MHYKCIFYVFVRIESSIHIFSQLYCTNPLFYTILQNMMEIQAKEELLDLKAELEQGEKICRKTYLV